MINLLLILFACGDKNDSATDTAADTTTQEEVQEETEDTAVE